MNPTLAILLKESIPAENPIVIPKLTLDDFKIKNNYYVVTDGSVFNYYTIKVEDINTDRPFFRLEKNPPIILSGFAIIDKKIYEVPVQDLMRRIVRKSREISLEVINGSTATDTTTIRDSNSESTIISSSGTSSTEIVSTETVQSGNERRSGRKTEVEIGKAADATWQDQIRTLFSTISEEEGFEEEWEIADSP